MVDVQLLNRLSALAARKRWMIGLTVGSRCRSLRVALVGAEGRGLSGRVEVLAADRLVLPRGITRLFRQLCRNRNKSSGDAPLLAAQLAESQALLLDAFAARIAPVWDRVLAVAVDDPGLWRRVAGWTAYMGLCDTARLAELSGLNVIDAFPARDLAQEGHGRPILPIPHWILLHDAEKPRVLLTVGRATRLTYLPGSRDSSGASRIRSFRIKAGPNRPDDWLPRAIVDGIGAQFPSLPHIEEIVFSGPPERWSAVEAPLVALLPGSRVVNVTALGIPSGALRPAGVAVLGLLYLDQVPGNVTGITAARTPRVLGRLTPGSLQSYHRLIRELAAAKPTVVALRSAV
jgi:1,6-anhydro-N-acetylmuramate kinase